jgi:L-malate glycosyltransferase
MLTVLLATRNRAAVLREALEAFCRLESPQSGWKMVVVDNGSTDETAAVLACFANRLPLHTVSEAAGGKNSALNAGLEFVKGDLTVLTDDDTFPHPNWLVELRKAADAHPEYVVFGGAIVPRWESAPPPWVQWLPEKGPVYGLTDPHLEEGPVSPGLVFGANMAIRTAVFRSGVRFDPLIGPSNTSYAMGSETQLTKRLALRGHKSWHVRGAVVEHFVSAYQICQSWALKRTIKYGRGRFRLRDLEERPEGLSAFFVGPKWFGVPRKVFRGIAREAMIAIIALPIRNEKARFIARWKLHFFLGSIIEAHASYRGGLESGRRQAGGYISPEF